VTIREHRGEAFAGQPGHTYRVNHGPGYFLPHAILLLFAACFGAGAADARGADQIALVVLTTILAASLVLACWLTLPTWNDELTIYRDGFEYRRHGRVSAHRWTDIDGIAKDLTSDRRLKATSVTLRTGERLRFAYRMRGLDLLAQEYADWSPLDDAACDQPLPATEPEPEQDRGLGAHRATHRVRPGCGGVLVVAIVGGPTAFMLLYFVSQPGLASFACFAPLGLLTFVLVRTMVAHRHDQLDIYEHGFTYRSRKGTQQCLWDEIEHYQTSRSGSLVALKKIDGPWIHFADSMEGIEDLKPYARTVVRRVERPDESP
jgi:hypothetical protein